MKIALYEMHPAPYRDPVIALLSKKENLFVKVFFLSPKDIGHDFWNIKPPEFDYAFLPCVMKRNGRSWFHRRFVMDILLKRYDVYVWCGFITATSVLGILLCLLLKRKYVIQTDSVEDASSNAFVLWLKKKMYCNAKFVWVPGKATKEFLVKRYSLSDESIVIGGYALDNADIAERIRVARSYREKIRAEIGVQGTDKMFLMVANMIPNRCYPITASGFIDAVNDQMDCKFVMVGRGPHLEIMQGLAKKGSCLKIIDGCSFEEMLKLYAAADVYVHGGKEPASTALVIGAISRLPLMSSKAVGCSSDVLFDNKTGILVQDYQSITCWAKAFRSMISLEDRWAEFGANAYKEAQSISADVVSEEIFEKCK